jgi:hypothetical protein
LLLGQDLIENDVKEGEHGAEEEVAANTGVSMPCEMAKPQPQVVGSIESQDLIITDINLGMSTDKSVQLEEVQTILASPISIASPSLPMESTILDMVLHAVQVIYRLSTHRNNILRVIYVRML